jgi:hypothetical protein
MMKIFAIKAFLLFLLTVSFLPLCFAQQKQIALQLDHSGNQLSFIADEIKKAAAERKYTVTVSSGINAKPAADVVVRIISDSAASAKYAADETLAKPLYLGWQSYAIRVRNSGGQKNIYILAGDKTGAMYGGLDVAEAIRLQTLNSLADADNKPYLERRGIKFNIPLDLRTPSYTDPSDAAQQNIPHMWEKSFWATYLDEMAKYRYNVLTLWSLHPFPSMVKIPEFPDVALDDVWRTKEKLDDSYSFTGVNFVRPAMLQQVEVVKKMTIDEKIHFWKEVMQMAADRGIDVYIFTWNIFTYGAEGKHGITNRQENDTTVRYFRAAVREMVQTYPLLAGIGITAGEAMNGKLKGEQASEKWLSRTYGEGIRDALQKEPARRFRLIHRFHQTSLSEIKSAFRDYPGPIDLSLKYAIAHMYSITNPPFVEAAMPLLSQQTKSWLTIRNDDVYSFRWANNDFARQFIKDIPQPEKISGYYMGPDGYNWGRDYLTKGPEHQLILQKQWYSFMLWGRLSYNPDLPDAVFTKALQTRFPSVPVHALYQPWSAASMIFPWITRFVWGDIDLKWLPEANLSHPRHKGFYTVADYIEREPMPGSRIRNIYLWAKYKHEGKDDSLQSPMTVADTLSHLAGKALSGLKGLPPRKIGSFKELDQTLGDIEAFAHVGNYYAAKIRAACSLANFDQFGNEKDRQEAIRLLEEAKEHWKKYADVYQSLYKPALYNRVGFVNIPELLTKVEADIVLVKQWKPGTINYQPKYTTEAPFRH